MLTSASRYICDAEGYPAKNVGAFSHHQAAIVYANRNFKPGNYRVIARKLEAANTREIEVVPVHVNAEGEAMYSEELLTSLDLYPAESVYYAAVVIWHDRLLVTQHESGGPGQLPGYLVDLEEGREERYEHETVLIPRWLSRDFNVSASLAFRGRGPRTDRGGGIEVWQGISYSAHPAGQVNPGRGGLLPHFWLPLEAGQRLRANLSGKILRAEDQVLVRWFEEKKDAVF